MDGKQHPKILALRHYIEVHNNAVVAVPSARPIYECSKTHDREWSARHFMKSFSGSGHLMIFWNIWAGSTPKNIRIIALFSKDSGITQPPFRLMEIQPS